VYMYGCKCQSQIIHIGEGSKKSCNKKIRIDSDKIIFRKIPATNLEFNFLACQ
jgi:hypothetical protein